MDMSSFFGQGGFGGGGAAGGDKIFSLLSSIMQSNAKRKQGALKTVANAEMMRYSPWTGLAGQAASAQGENMNFVPGADMSQGINKILGLDKAQAESNSRYADTQSHNQDILRLMMEQAKQGK